MIKQNLSDLVTRQWQHRTETLTAHIAELETEVRAFRKYQERERALVEAGEALKADLFSGFPVARADWDDEVKVVVAGATAWRNFCEALAAYDSDEPDQPTPTITCPRCDQEMTSDSEPDGCRDPDCPMLDPSGQFGY